MALDAHLLLRSSGLIARHSFSVTTLPPWHSSFMKKAVSFNTVFCLSVGFACHVSFLGSGIGQSAGWSPGAPSDGNHGHGGQGGGDEERGRERDRYSERDRNRDWQRDADSARW